LRIASRAEHADQALGRRAGRLAEFLESQRAPPVGRPSPRPSPCEGRGEGEEAAVRGRAWADAAAKAR
jgi:hypothetical protein